MKSITDKPIVSSKEDLLSIHRYANALASFICNSDTPITIGLQGEWGTGKTSLMGILLEMFQEDHVATSWVNTWEYSMFRGAKETTPAVLNGMLEKLEQSCRDSGNWDVGDETSQRVKQVGKFLSRAANQMVTKQTGLDLMKAAEGNLPAESQAEIAAVKAEISAIIEKLMDSETNPYERVVFFVDDLDRIPPGDAVEVLEALKNIFDIPNCVFVLAIDYEVVVKGLESKFGKKTDDNERQFRSFFDKIIQVPFSMPIGAYTIDAFLLDKLKGLGIKGSDEVGADYAKVTRFTIGPNPRSLKRYLNSFSLINEVRAAEGDTSENEASEEDNFALFCMLGIQISYPKIFRMMVQEPMFTNWGIGMAGRLGVDLAGVQTQIEALGDNDLIDEEWEQVAWGASQKDPYLKSRVFDVLSLLNFMRDRFGDELESTMEGAIEFASITAVDDDQGMKSSVEKGKKVVFEGIAPKIQLMRDAGCNEQGIEAYERLFTPLFELADREDHYRVSLAKTGASFNDDRLGKKERMLMYINNPSKRKSGFGIGLMDKLCDSNGLKDLQALLELLKQHLGVDDSSFIRLNPPGRYRASITLENGLPEEIGHERYMELMDFIVGLIHD